MKNIEDNTRVIGLIQMNCCNNSDQNLQVSIDSIREATAKGAQIILSLIHI